MQQACSFSEAAKRDLEAFHQILLRRYVGRSGSGAESSGFTPFESGYAIQPLRSGLFAFPASGLMYFRSIVTGRIREKHRIMLENEQENLS